MALILGAFGSVAPPIDILSHFNGHFLGVVVTAVVALLLRRRAGAVMAAGLLTTVALHGLLSTNAYRANAGPLAPHTVKVVSLNAWELNREVERIETFLRDTDADIVFLYEFTGRKRRLLERLKPLYPYQRECAGLRGCHIAMLSKLRWREAGIQPRAPGRAKMVWATFGEGGRRFSVVGAHLLKPLDGPWRQEREIDDLGRQVRRLGDPVILAGDMNATPWSAVFERIESRSALRKIDGIRTTWPAAFGFPPQLAIDHFLTSKSVVVENVSVGRRVGSDHLPLIGVFRIDR